MTKFTFYNQGITVIGVLIDNVINIGAAKCGKNEKGNKQIGEQIAEGRAVKRPISFYEPQFKTLNAQKKEFKAVAMNVCSTIANSKQWSLKNLRS